MSTRKKPVSFVDAADIYLETASPTEVRDLAVMVATYSKARKLDFRVTVADVIQPKENDVQGKP